MSSWNWCRKCKQLVDADDVHDGSEIVCHGCDRVYIVVEYQNGTWGLTYSGHRMPRAKAGAK